MILDSRACAVLLLVLPATAAPAQRYSWDALQRFELSNGLQIVVAEDHTAPIAMVLVAVRAGASVQAEDERGMAHLFEHLLFESYGGGADRFWTAVFDLMGTSNGATDVESAQYYLVVPSQSALEGVRLLGRLMSSRRLSVQGLDDERKVVLDELERREVDPEEVLARRVSRELWGSAWHRRDIGGDSASLMGITEAQLRDAYARDYVPDNAVLVVTGDVRPDEVLEAAERHFASWKRAEGAPADGLADTIPPLTGSRAVVLLRSVPDVTLRIALQGPSQREDAAGVEATHMLVELLNRPRSAFQERLTGSGLFQRLELSFDPLMGIGEITIVGKTADTTAQDALSALLSEIDNLEALPGVTDQDVAAATRRQEVVRAIVWESAALLAPYLADWWARGALDPARSRADGEGAYAIDELRRVARQYLARRPKVIGVMGPSPQTDRLAEWLQGLVREDR